MSDIKKIDDVMDLDRTDKLFSSSIDKAGSLTKGEYREEDIKKQRLVIGFGNLHVNTAKVKMSAVRLMGYRDNLAKLKQNIGRKVRNSRKYGSF